MTQQAQMVRPIGQLAAKLHELYKDDQTFVEEQVKFMIKDDPTISYDRVRFFPRRRDKITVKGESGDYVYLQFDSFNTFSAQFSVTWTYSVKDGLLFRESALTVGVVDDFPEDFKRKLGGSSTDAEEEVRTKWEHRMLNALGCSSHQIILPEANPVVILPVGSAIHSLITNESTPLVASKNELQNSFHTYESEVIPISLSLK